MIERLMRDDEGDFIAVRTNRDGMVRVVFQEKNDRASMVFKRQASIEEFIEHLRASIVTVGEWKEQPE